MKLSNVLIGLPTVTLLVAIFLNAALKKSNLPKYKLAIGILSARENFAQRDTIRSTWLSVLKDSKFAEEVFATFVLANEDCKIPLEYRADKYSCKGIRLPQSVPLGVHELLGERTVAVTEEYSKDQAAVGFDFVITQDVVVTGISIPASKGRSSIVQLWDLASNVLVVESAAHSPSNNNQVWDHRQIDAYLLAKGFVGSVIVSCGNGPCVGIKNWFNESSFHVAVEISPIIRFSLMKDEFPINIIPTDLKEMAIPASLSLELTDPTSIEKLTAGKSSRYKERLRSTDKITATLIKEHEKHGDILILSDINGQALNEVYRNLPRKLVSFHNWCNDFLEAEFIMKTDDDSYVDVEKAIQSIEKLNPESVQDVWIGNFRRNWPVDTYGKWEEHSYTSPVYPAYACGAGYVVSSGISRFLSTNKAFLKWYQGEDVSMGIWLSALNVQYIQEDGFICDDTCLPSMAVSTQHSRRTLLQMWSNRLKCGNACKCV